MQPDRGCSVAPFGFAPLERRRGRNGIPEFGVAPTVRAPVWWNSEARRRGGDVPRLAANRAVAGPLPGERQRLGASCRSASGWCYLDTGSAPTARPATGAPASSPNPSALNTDTFPPSRLLA